MQKYEITTFRNNDQWRLLTYGIRNMWYYISCEMIARIRDCMAWLGQIDHELYDFNKGPLFNSSSSESQNLMKHVESYVKINSFHGGSNIVKDKLFAQIQRVLI